MSIQQIGAPRPNAALAMMPQHDDDPTPVAPGRVRYLCRVRTPNPARTFSFTLSGVSFEHRRMRTYSKRDGREPVALAPTHDLLPAKVAQLEALLPLCLLRRGTGVVKPKRQADGSYAAPLLMEGDEPLIQYVDFVPYIDSANAASEQATLKKRIAELEVENAKLRAERGADSAESKAVEAEENDEAARAAQAAGNARTVGPRHRKGASGEVPGSA